jgi:hypothetical protein
MANQPEEIDKPLVDVSEQYTSLKTNETHGIEAGCWRARSILFFLHF